MRWSWLTKPPWSLQRHSTATFNRLNLWLVVIFAGDQCQQQPLQTVEGRTTATTSIINNHTFTSVKAIHHMLYHQFRITDPEYAIFLDFIRFTQPTREQVDRMQEGIILCPPGSLCNEQLLSTFNVHSQSTMMTVSSGGAQRINSNMVFNLLAWLVGIWVSLHLCCVVWVTLWPMTV